jgi:hypothetical protein
VIAMMAVGDRSAMKNMGIGKNSDHRLDASSGRLG